MDGLSKLGLSVWNHLSEDERTAIQRGNPFKHERNSIVKKLRSRGVEIKIIQEISGIPGSTISRIGNTINADQEPAAVASEIVKLLKKIDLKVTKLYRLMQKGI